MSMTDTPTELSPRLQQFQAEVDELKVTGGKANPERAWVVVGIILMIAGIVLTIVSYSGTHNTTNVLEQADYNMLSNIGIAVTVVGAVLFLVMSLQRYLRFWLIRLIYEQREQADRIIRGR